MTVGSNNKPVTKTYSGIYEMLSGFERDDSHQK